MSNQVDHSKFTPQKPTSRSHKKKLIEDALAKDLFSPFRETLPINLLVAFTPLRKQPEYLLSPSPVKRDLFTQLLGTEAKQYSPLEFNHQIQEESASCSSISEDNSDNSMDEEESGDNQGNWSDENGIKKRKRKSTAQIKLLKQELDGQMNWTKEKIVRMAQVTGLSQSQVYKWCWDQKKKQNKGRDDNFGRGCFERRKIIRKSLNYRTNLPVYEEELHSGKTMQKNMENHAGERRQQQTKIKKLGIFGELEVATEKKVNKRLVFH